MKDEFSYFGQSRVKFHPYTLADLMQPGMVVMDVGPDSSAKIEIEGGDTRTDVRFAVRVAQGDSEGTYVERIDDKGFLRGADLYHAYLWNSADDAAKAIADRNREYPRYEPKQYVIVPVTLTTRTARYQITTTITPAKTEYVVGRVGSGFSVLFGTDGWKYRTDATQATHFSTADEAAKAIQKYGNTRIWSIKVFETKAEKKTDRKQVTPAHTTRSL